MPYYFAANVIGMMGKTRTIVSKGKGQLYTSWDKKKYRTKNIFKVL